MPFVPLLVAALLTQAPAPPTPRQGNPPGRQAPRAPQKKTQPASPAAFISAAAAARQGLTVVAAPQAFPAEWFARRYGVAPPSVEATRLANPIAPVDVYALKPAPDDAGRLWSGLLADLAPNQALAEKRGVIGLVISRDDNLRRKAVALIRPTRQATARPDLNWLPAEMPRDIPGLAHVYARFLTQLPELEGRAAGVSLRAVYQASYSLARSSAPRGLAQADFWVPRDPSQFAGLVRALDSRKTGEQTIMSGKGVAVIVSTRTDEATGILVEFLKQKGYKLESRVAAFK